jgi:flagellar basal-body rod protein FlgC
MFGSFDVSTSALVAQRIRMDAIAGNIANATTAGRIDGAGPSPYQRRVALFKEGDGRGGPGVRVARIVSDPNPPRAAYEPGHPLADERGRVFYPNVDLADEMVDGIAAARSFEANVTAIEATKAMLASTLRILA